ncbi:unnamed protein product [Onchocerca ochengi]|uniref:Uncharacterized protein n=2 Tax=Onchocerca ochengi TaxID=42157 RepID=A0A182EZ71_ONCOC|nr:unnamed protein product [Onchocerca ochengi]
MISSALILCMVLITQGVQGWWYPGGYGYGYNYYHHHWYHPGPFHHPHVYHAPYIYHLGHWRNARKGAQIGAAIGLLAGTFGKKK